MTYLLKIYQLKRGSNRHAAFPVLFKIYSQLALKKWMKSCEGPEILKANENILYTIFFVDDQVILGEAPENTK